MGCVVVDVTLTRDTTRGSLWLLALSPRSLSPYALQYSVRYTIDIDRRAAGVVVVARRSKAIAKHGISRLVCVDRTLICQMMSSTRLYYELVLDVDYLATYMLYS